jgi:hypothetical protein
VYDTDIKIKEEWSAIAGVLECRVCTLPFADRGDLLGGDLKGEWYSPFSQKSLLDGFQGFSLG